MSWDVDGNGQLDSLTDGRLVLLYLLGLRNRASIENSVATDATRTTFEQIIEYLDGIREELDIDGNGIIDALTDGVLNYRSQLGLTDEALIRNAIGEGATRFTSEAVLAYLESLSEDEPIPIETGITLETATDVTLASTNRTYTSQVGGENPSGYLEFSVGATNEFNLSISDLSADANVEIIDQQSGEVILSSTNAGLVDESISGILETGTYGIRIFSADGASTDYNLDLSVTPQLRGITTGGSDVPIQITTNVSGPLINLDDFRPDLRFTGVDGSDFATVILDTGINLDHPFFGPDEDSDGTADRIVYHQDFADNDFDASDVNGHGSNVSSIVASSDSTFTGIAPGADIIHLKVFTDAGGGSFGYIEQALQWVLENVDEYNIASVNMSLGDVVDSDGDGTADIGGNYSTPQMLYNIDDELAALAAQNVIVVSASGNDYFGYQSPGVGYPAADPNSLSIGAVYDSNVGGRSFLSGAEDFTTGTDRITSFSQRHPTLTTVFAPGAFITGAAPNSNGTLTQGGTSQAAPHVAGMAVLAQQLAVQELGRRLTPAEFSDLLVSTGVTINDGDDENGNVINTGLDFKRADMFALAEAILSLAPNQPPVATNDSATVDFQTSAIIDVLANDTDENGDNLSISGFSSLSSQGGAIALEGDALRYTPASGFSGNDSFQYSISDGNGGTDSATVNVTVSPAPNQPPVAVNDSATMTAGTTATINAIANDNDPDGDPLNITGVSNPLNGSANINGNQLIYIPGQSPSGNPFTGQETFTYTISDGQGGADTATISVTVNPPPNSNPVAVNDAVTVNGGGTTQIAVLTNDSDSDGDNLSISGWTSTSVNGGTIIQNGNELVYTAPTNFSGSNDSFIYSISDGQGGTDSATVNVTILNSPPVANNDAATVPFETNATLAVLTNDSDQNGDSISISGLASISANGGTISQNGNQLVYSPPAEFSGNDSFSYSIADVRGAIASATVNLTVSQAPNNVPVAVNDSAIINAVGTVNIPVLINDSDPDGDILSISGFASASANGGTIGQNGNQLAYTPSASFTGNDSFSYSISDGRGGTDSATVNVTVANSSPVANNDSATVNSGETATLTVLANDSDPDGDNLSISGFSSRSATGAIISQSGNQLVYSRDANFSGNDSFSYSISDGRGGTDSATVNITVLNRAPVAVNDGTTVNAGTTATIAVLANDSDPDGDNLSISGFSSQSANGGTISQAGTQLQYSPPASFSGNDSFSYSISDGQGGTDSATVNVTLINQSPIAVNDATTVNAGETATVAVLANDSDPDGDNLSISGFSSQSANGGTISQAGTELQYSPPASFSGNDSFSYSISDGNGGADVATVNVTVLNRNPVANNDAAIANLGETVNISVLTNDSDPDGDNLSISGFASRSAIGGTISQSGNQLQYSPPAGFRGVDNFSYSISDGQGGTDSATVNITVINRSPVANNDAVTIPFESSATLAVLANDSDPDGDALQIATVNSPGNGTALAIDNQAFYIAAAGFSGNDSFTYAIVDGNGGSDSATVNVTVSPRPNQPPVGNNDVVTIPVVGSSTLDVLLNDSDPDGDTIQVIGAGGNALGLGGLTVVNGNVIYTPNQSLGTTSVGSDAFTYTISDIAGNTDTATVALTIGGIQPPIAINDTAITSQALATTISVLANDTDIDGGTISITGVSTPANGSVSINNNGTTNTTTDDRIVYTPNPTFVGTDSFTYSITDGQGSTDSAQVVVTIESNLPPVANNDVVTVPVSGSSTLDVLANDSDPNVGDIISVTGVSGNAIPSLGSVAIANGQVLYIPSSNLGTGFVGTDSFTYSIADAVGAVDTATVTVTLGGNQPVDAVNDTVTVVQAVTNTLSVLANDSDPDGGTLAITGVSTATNGIVTISDNGTPTVSTDDVVLYSPNSTTFTGTDSFTYGITDGQGSTDSATVRVTVEANQGPTAVNDSFTLSTPTTISVLDNDSDPNSGDTLSVIGVGSQTNQAAAGTVALTGGNVIYSPVEAAATGTTGTTDSFIYTISDISGNTSTASVSVTVGGPVPPIANPDSVTVTQSTTQTLSAGLTSNDSDPNGDVISIVGVTAPTSGGTANVTSGQVIYTAPNTAGTDTFTYSIADGTGTDSATVTVSVIAGSTAPVANNDYAIAITSQSVTIPVLESDSDPNGDTLSITGVSTPANGTTSIFDNGTIISSDDQIIYTGAIPGATDTFTYSITDGNGGTDTATVTVGVFNDAAGTSRAITGDANKNVLAGSNGTAVNEALSGGSGNDILIGRGGGDQLTGNAGADEFRFLAATDSGPNGIDLISDFDPSTELDTIRLAFLSTSTNVSLTSVGFGLFNLTIAGTTFNLSILTDPAITDTNQIINAIQYGS